MKKHFNKHPEIPPTKTQAMMTDINTIIGIFDENCSKFPKL
tara:strand:- start:741 stop:863 length:123 start_codon:yes stop_codon:yes gene_type:complete